MCVECVFGVGDCVVDVVCVGVCDGGELFVCCGVVYVELCGCVCGLYGVVDEEVEIVCNEGVYGVVDGDEVCVVYGCFVDCCGWIVCG